MNAMLLILVAVVVLVAAYIFYGSWLSSQWGIDTSRPTPAHELEDDVDYVPAPPYVVLGHHFSSIAGAGPINGPIQAAVFGWVPVALWILVGGVFFGAMHDMGSLLASVRHKGQTLAIVVRDNMDNTSKTLFTVFAYLTLVLLVAAFVSIVAGTFGVTGADPVVDERNQTTASISVSFIVAAIVWGVATRGRRVPMLLNIALSICTLVACVAVGMLYHPIALSVVDWIWVLAIYVLIASLAPVWILLQPRDYLSSYLLYSMILLAIIGIVGAGFLGQAHLDIPAFTGFSATAIKEAGGSTVATTGFLFPALFITIACGAISGFHSLVASGTTSKIIDSEAHIQPIGYGGMLIECLVAIISLCAVGFVWNSYITGADYATPAQIFAGGLSGVLAVVFGEGARDISFQLLVLAVSAFCLTSLDTATRLARYMFQELWIPVGETLESLSGWRAQVANPYVATVVTVIFGVYLGMTGYSIIWPLFGAANQLLAALALLSVAVWLKNAGRNNKMFYVPMVFMMLVTLTSLAITIYQKAALLAGGAAVVAAQPGGLIGVITQLIIASLLFVLALVLALKGARSLSGTTQDAASTRNVA